MEDVADSLKTAAVERSELRLTLRVLEEENRRSMAELREENRMSMAELRAALKEIEERADRRCKKMDARIDKLARLYGDVSKNIGLHAESFFQDALETSLRFGDLKFDDFKRNLAYSKRKNCEFDFALVNGDSLALIEIKNRIHPKFVEELATKKLTQFRKFQTTYANYRVYLGVAGFSFDPEVLVEAKKYGVGVIRQVGDAIRVDKGRLKVY
jgi:hypothetical protein